MGLLQRISSHRAWDGSRVALGKLQFPVVVVGSSGEARDWSPRAAELLAGAGLALEKDRSLPEALWRKLGQALEGSRVDWHDADGRGAVTLSRYALGDGHFVVVMHESCAQFCELSQQLYRSSFEFLGRMTASAVHDLRSPLASMTFNAEVLKRRWGELPPAKIADLLDCILESCRGQAAAVDSLFERVRPTPHTVWKLEQILDEVAERLRPLFRSGSNRLRTELEPNLTVMGTALTLDHIFATLLGNAVEAATRPVTVKVHGARCAATRAGGGDGTVCVTVADNGPGIPPQVRARLFHPFTTSKAHGTGMGLCLSREAARDIGGELLLVESSPEGTTFEVRLRAARPDAARHT